MSFYKKLMGYDTNYLYFYKDALRNLHYKEGNVSRLHALDATYKKYYTQAYVAHDKKDADNLINAFHGLDECIINIHQMTF